MAEAVKESIQERLRDGADKAALNTLIRDTDLRGEKALRVARRVVTAAAPSLRAQYANELAATTQQELISSGLLAIAAVAADVTVFGMLFARGGRKARLLAVAAAGMHAGLVGYAKAKQRRMIAGARQEASVRLPREQANA